MKRCARPILMPRWCLIPRISHIARPDFFCSILAILFALFMPAPSSHAAGKDLLRLENQSETDILNIRVTAGKKDFFLRLDLAPNDSDEVENPDLVANLRVDYGLFFCFMKKCRCRMPLPWFFAARMPTASPLTLRMENPFICRANARIWCQKRIQGRFANYRALRPA